MDDLGATVGTTNIQGEEVKRLDVLSNETLVHFLVTSGQLCLGASEVTDILPLAARLLVPCVPCTSLFDLITIGAIRS